MSRCVIPCTCRYVRIQVASSEFEAVSHAGRFRGPKFVSLSSFRTASRGRRRLARSVKYRRMVKGDTQMNASSQPVGLFERRRLNRAIFLVAAMALTGIALNDGVHAFMTAGTEATPRTERVAPRGIGGTPPHVIAHSHLPSRQPEVCGSATFR